MLSVVRARMPNHAASGVKQAPGFIILARVKHKPSVLSLDQHLPFNFYQVTDSATVLVPDNDSPPPPPSQVALQFQQEQGRAAVESRVEGYMLSHTIKGVAMLDPTGGAFSLVLMRGPTWVLKQILMRQ